MRWARHVARMAETNLYKIMVGKFGGKRPLRRSRCSSDDNIRMDLREIGWKGVDRIHLAQDRDPRWALLNSVLNLRVPLKAGNVLTE